MEDFGLGVNIRGIEVNPTVVKEAPDQNRTDTSSLEGYGSTIELQAQRKSHAVLPDVDFFSNHRF